MARATTVVTPLERFERRFVKGHEDECWQWQGSTTKGYGKFGVMSGVSVLAHRYAYEAYVGLIPHGMKVCHRCDNRGCVNPNHFFLGTNGDNTRDMFAKGRGRPGFRKGLKPVTAKIDQEKADLIRHLWRFSGRTQESIGRNFNLTQSQVSRIVSRDRGTWTAATGCTT